MESGFQGGGPGGTKLVNQSRDERLAVDGDFEAWATSGPDAGAEETEFARDVLDCVDVLGGRADQHRARRLGKQTEQRMLAEGTLLLDGGSDAFGERGLSCSHGNSAIGNVASGVNELAIREGLQQRVQIRFGIQIERRRCAPETVEQDLGVFGGAENAEF